MKTRTSFVANSSSSSFIVGFKKVPKTVEDVRAALFPKESLNGTRRAEYGDEGYRILDIAEAVLNNIKSKGAKPISSEKAIIEEIRNGWFEGYPDTSVWNDPRLTDLHDRFQKKWGIPWQKSHNEGKVIAKYAKDIAKIEKMYDRLHKEEDDATKAAAKKLWEKHKKSFEGTKLFVFSFSDGDGPFNSFMEHGNIFGDVPHVTISHH